MYKTIGTPEGTRDRLFAECAAVSKGGAGSDGCVSASGVLRNDYAQRGIL